MALLNQSVVGDSSSGLRGDLPGGPVCAAIFHIVDCRRSGRHAAIAGNEHTVYDAQPLVRTPFPYKRACIVELGTSPSMANDAIVEARFRVIDLVFHWYEVHRKE